MTINELIMLLRNIQAVHPEATVVEARTAKGRVSTSVSLRLKDHVIVIEGDFV